jgi:hypothetical protein
VQKEDGFRFAHGAVKASTLSCMSRPGLFSTGIEVFSRVNGVGRRESRMTRPYNRPGSPGVALDAEHDRPGGAVFYPSNWMHSFPQRYQRSNAALVARGMPPYGAAALGEIDRIVQRLHERSDEPDAWAAG